MSTRETGSNEGGKALQPYGKCKKENVLCMETTVTCSGYVGKSGPPPNRIPCKRWRVNDKLKDLVLEHAFTCPTSQTEFQGRLMTSGSWPVMRKSSWKAMVTDKMQENTAGSVNISLGCSALVIPEVLYPSLQSADGLTEANTWNPTPTLP